MQRSIFALFGAFALLAASCGDDDTESAATTTTSTIDTTTSSDPAPTATTQPTEGWQRCENPEGFTVAFPNDWETNDGEVTETCSLFDPASFEVPEATDARAAAVSAYVDDVPFHEIAAPDDGDDRAITVVDGHHAVRTVGSAGELYGAGTERTAYAVDLALGVDDGPGTLFLDVVDLESVDYEAAVTVLDRMVATVDLDVADESEPGVVARYEGAAPWTARLSDRAGEPCLTAPATDDGTTECFTGLSPNALRVADFSGALFSAAGGVTGDAVFRVDLTTGSGTLSYLPVTPRVGQDGSADGIRGWAAPVPLSDVERVTWSAIDGQQLGERTIDDENDVGPVGSFRSPPVATDDFPASGEASLLTDVRVAGHEGFDRIVFEFGERGDDVSYSVESVDTAIAPSGEDVDVQGEATLRVTMTPAAGVDLSGDEPRVTYEGSERIDPSATTVVDEIAEVEDFESTLTWAVGLTARQDVAVVELADPYRLVIDVGAG